MELTNAQMKIKYSPFNPNNVLSGDTVVVNIGSQYFAVITNVEPDNRENKMWAYLRSNNKMCPARVDIKDCQRIQNVI
jgi:hypothetical protein